jgi:azurin
MAHNWVLLKKETDVDAFVNQCNQYEENEYLDPGLNDQIIVHTGMVGGGEQETITFKAPADPGRYTYVCTFPGHYVAGMKGTLIVQE